MMRLLLVMLGTVSLASADPMPDLRLDTGVLGSSVSYDLQLFDPNDPATCELQPADLCIGGPGVRKLLRFSVLAVNQGSKDLVVGEPNPNDLLPTGEPKFVYSTCHKHYHFQTFARYELRPRGGTTPVLLGQKRSFCVEDTKKVDAAAPDTKKYGCVPGGLNVQGVQVGWGDLYPSNLPCQWIDVTDVQGPGEFDLCVFINTAGLLEDADRSNDQGCVPITLAGPPAGATPPKLALVAPHARQRVKAGKRLKIAWRKRVKGEFKFFEVHFSRDGGSSWRFVAGGTTAKRNAVVWTVPADAITDAARVKVAVWSRGPGSDADAGTYLRSVRESGTFRIVP